MRQFFILSLLTLSVFKPLKSQSIDDIKSFQNKVDSFSYWLKVQENNIKNLDKRDTAFQKSYEDLQHEILKIKQLNLKMIQEIQGLKGQINESTKQGELKKAPKVNDSAIAFQSYAEFDYKTEPESTDKIERTRNFYEFCNQFIKDLMEKGDSALQKYYYNPQQIYYIASTMDSYTFSEIIQANDLKNDPVWCESIAKFRATSFGFNEGTKPKVNCEMGGFYDKQGIYGGIESEFNLVSKAFIDLQNERVRDNVLNKMKQEEAMVNTFLFSTDGHLCFHFIKTEGRWGLYCIQIEIPCTY